MLGAAGYKSSVYNEQSMRRNTDCEGQISEECCFLRAHALHPSQLWGQTLKGILLTQLFMSISSAGCM